MDTIKKIGKVIAKSKAKIIMLVVIAVFCAATIYAAAANSYTITLDIDGEVTRVTTMRQTAEEILNQAGVVVGENDILDLSEFSDGTDSTIKLYKGYSVTVSDNCGEAVSCIGNGSVGLTLLKNGITLKDGDELNCSVNDRLYDGMEISVIRAFPVKIMADGETVTVNLASGTVSDALDKAVIAIDDDDIISKSLDTVLEKDLLVKITRVAYVDRVEKVEIPFKTVTKNDASMYTDQYKIEKAGVKGQKTITYSEKFVDGELTESTAVNTVVEKEAVDEIRIVGTKKRAAAVSGVTLANGKKTISRLTPPASLQLDKNYVPVSYKKKIVGTASAYSGGGRTATGKSVMPGYIAVNPRQIPYGTKMWIVSNDGRYIYGYASAEDTGGFTKWTGNRATLCDLYFPDSASMNKFGRRSVTIYIL
ncbi:MAG: DUF348 domain-containing protein [Clostridia bacterium]|nr:DUF348 domain-containing protein [Clostridia bacterium]